MHALTGPGRARCCDGDHGPITAIDYDYCNRDRDFHFASAVPPHAQDTVLLLSSGKVPLAEGDLEDFEEKLEAVCDGLAEDVVRNGEGTAHVMQVRCGTVRYGSGNGMATVTVR